MVTTNEEKASVQNEGRIGQMANRFVNVTSVSPCKTLNFASTCSQNAEKRAFNLWKEFSGVNMDNFDTSNTIEYCLTRNFI